MELLLQSEVPGKAIPYLMSLIEHPDMRKRPKDVVPYTATLGHLLEERGDLDGAARAYKSCCEADAKNAAHAMNLGRVLMAARKNEQALHTLQPLIIRIDRMPLADRATILQSLASIHARLGDAKKARQFATRVLAIDPDNETAKSLM